MDSAETSSSQVSRVLIVAVAGYYDAPPLVQANPRLATLNLLAPCPVDSGMTPDLKQCQWLAFTSANGVMGAGLSSLALPAGLRLAAVGSATARALEAAGLPVHLMPLTGNADGLAAALASAGKAHNILWACGRKAKPWPPYNGMAVTRWEVYDTAPHPGVSPAIVAEATTGLQPQAIGFTSPSAVRAASQWPALAGLMSTLPVGAIGTSTRQALLQIAPHQPIVMPERPGLAELAQSLFKALQ